MARLKEAACSTSFCFFLPLLLLLLLFCLETLSSTGLKRQREREREKKPSFGSPSSAFLSLRNYLRKSWARLEGEKTSRNSSPLIFFSFSFFLCHDTGCETTGKWISNSDNNNKQEDITRRNFRGNIYETMDVGRRRWVAPCRGQLNILSHRSNGGIHISARPLCWPATISLRNIIIFHIRGNGKFSTRIFLRTFVSLLLFLLLLVQVAVWTVSPTLLNREQYQVAIIKKEVKERTVTKHFFFFTLALA